MSYYSDIFTPEDACVPSSTSEKPTNKFTLTEMKKDNANNFISVKLQLNRMWKGHYLRTATVSYYKTSPNAGTRIIHAISGEPLAGLVGTRAEDQYFKVKMASYGPAENGTLFYLSKNEYENHHYCDYQ
jgi:hypothetical protein